MTPEQGSQNPISPEILSGLGLTSEIAAEVGDPETLRQHAILDIIERNGRSLYENHIQNGRKVHLVELFDKVDLGKRNLIKYYQAYSRDLLVGGISGIISFPADNFYGAKELKEIPDSLFIESRRFLLKEIVLGNYTAIISTFLSGFGNAALENRDYQTAVNAFDVSSDNGILNDQTVMERLKDIAQRDEVAGVRIALAIQGRISRKDAQTQSQVV